MFTFADSFDFYATTADITGYWDSGTPANISLTTGRFSGGRAIGFNNSTSVVV